MNNDHVEKRTSPRFLMNLPLEICSSDFRLETETKNISCTGVFCQVNRYIPVRTKLNVIVKFPLVKDEQSSKKELSCQAEVARIEPSREHITGNYDIGIMFSKIKAWERKVILNFIRQKNLKEAKELKRMYLQLKGMAARLLDIEECHPTAEHFRKVIDKAVEELDEVAHLLDHEINKVKNLR